MVDALAPDLLRGHVPGRAEDRARRSRVDGRDLAPAGVLLEDGAELGQAEVEDLHPAVPGEEEVLGLQVAVNDALLVRRGEAARDLDREVDRFPERQRPRGEALAQCLALEQLEDEVGRVALETDVEHREDVGVVERSRRSGLVREAAHPHGVGLSVGGDHLDRDFAANPRVAGAVDLARAPRAERRQDLVRTETCSPG